jgi:long-chain acyl-CoA synthetase
MVKGKAGLDRLAKCSTGGGPINPDLIVFFGAMGINLYQGYGLTETAPIINANTPKSAKLGTCGKPLAGVVEKIAEDGEILVKGPQVMQGYWNNPEANKETFTEDGWFKTGDIGFLDEQGFLTITDRKKELFKTSGGKYVAPQPIEYAFNTNPYVEQVAVVGDNRKYICALVVPEFNALQNWAKQQGLAFKDCEELVKQEKCVAFMQEQVNLINQHLARYEQIKKFTILSCGFTEEGGELTPSQKKKRRVIEKKYKALIDAMYPPDDGM